jgi:two-component system, chemotaxis family, CheB/CheR fusion protein
MFLKHETRSAFALTDSNRGVDLSLAVKIMTPFFTMKKESKGTGIGLSLSRTIARKHEGDLKLDSTRKHRSFVLELPEKR